VEKEGPVGGPVLGRAMRQQKGQSERGGFIESVDWDCKRGRKAHPGDCKKIESARFRDWPGRKRLSFQVGDG